MKLRFCIAKVRIFYVYIYAVAAALAVLGDTVTDFVRSDS